MHRLEAVSLLAVAAVVASGIALGARSVRPYGPRPRPRAVPVVLALGETVSVNGQLFTVSATLVPAGAVPVPVPTPPPIPTPTPTPGPLPGPSPLPVQVFEFRNGQRNQASVFAPGQTVFVEGSGFGTTPGTIKVNHTLVPVVTWTDTQIEILCPAFSGLIGPEPLDIMRADLQGWDSTIGFTILPAPVRKPAKEN